MTHLQTAVLAYANQHNLTELEALWQLAEVGLRRLSLYPPHPLQPAINLYRAHLPRWLADGLEGRTVWIRSDCTVWSICATRDEAYRSALDWSISERLRTGVEPAFLIREIRSQEPAPVRV